MFSYKKKSNLYKIYASAWRTHKRGESPDDCQDAYKINNTNNRYAIADGVSQSFFPAQWSQILVDHFCLSNKEIINSLFTTNNWGQWLKPCQEEWDHAIKNIVDNKITENLSINRNRYKSNECAGATFCGLEINNQNHKSIQWRSMIIGDCCLFHYRKNELLRDAS